MLGEVELKVDIIPLRGKILEIFHPKREDELVF